MGSTSKMKGLFPVILLNLLTLTFTYELSSWQPFWWWKSGSQWPSSVSDVLGEAYGSCSDTSDYCFQRLPVWAEEDSTEIMAIDILGTVYRWSFNPSNPTAHAAWMAFHDHAETPFAAVRNNQSWNPIAVEGKAPKATQDSFMYREQNGIKSLLLDDDNCDCLSSLSMGHGMCSAGHKTSYSEVNVTGVDYLYDPGCFGPRPNISLSLYFRTKKTIHLDTYGGGWTAFWWWTARATWPSEAKDVLGDSYGSCSGYDYYCFQRLPFWLVEDSTELLAIDSRGTVYKWSFNSSNPTGHAVWQAFHDHEIILHGKIKNSKAWNPQALSGKAPDRDQDSFQYFEYRGVKSIILDDDNGYYYTTLSMGHLMSGTKDIFGVDYLYDTAGSVSPDKGLTLYFRVERKLAETSYGGGWHAFWWWPPGAEWPSCKDDTKDVLDQPYGSCTATDLFCFQRLAAWAFEDKTELLAVDHTGNVYKWRFNSTNPTASAAWDALHSHTQTESDVIKDSSTWNPYALSGYAPKLNQDSFMYRKQDNIVSILLDDDNCDCLSSLNIGHSMCGAGTDTSAEDAVGVDNLYDPACNLPSPSNGLTLYFKMPLDMSFKAYAQEWSPFWWWPKDGTWPSKEKDVLGYSYGTCQQNDVYCFQRLPLWAIEDHTSLLAVDTEGNIYMWKFNSANPTAHAVWQAFHDHKSVAYNVIKNNQKWDPVVKSGKSPKANQDSFMYRTQNGVASVMLDDDNCDCLTTLSMGHGMCGSSHSTSYPKSKPNVYGVDALYDPDCNGPVPNVGLTLYFVSSRPLTLCTHGGNWIAFWWWSAHALWPNNENDVLGHVYGSCGPRDLYCFGRLPSWAEEEHTELLAFDSLGTVYKWQFDSNNPTAHAAWKAFHDHTDTPAGAIANNMPWNPTVLAGTAPKATQDSFMYRSQNGVKSILLDDDNCDCLTTLNIGHGMCGSGHSTSYGPAGQYGVDALYDAHCQVPRHDIGLTMYFRST